MEELNTFIQENNGKALDYDHEYGAQCMDLINYWAVALGKRAFTGNAVNVPGQNHDQWTWIANTPAGVPTPGSIVCFGANAKFRDITTGPYGHVDVFISGNTGSFTGFDQNWNDVQHCMEVSHSYDDVLGWLEPIGTVATPGTAEAIRTTNVRTAPSVSAPVTSVLQAGNTFTFTNIVTGDMVNQNGVSTNQWYHSTLGHYVWAGNCKLV